MINLIRSDDRLIHGQCMTRLVPHYKIKHILVIDEFTANDATMRFIVEKIALPGIKNDVFTMADSLKQIRESLNNNIGTMIVFRFPVIARFLFDEIEDLPKFLNVGPVVKREDTVTIMEGTYCSREELDCFEYLHQKGVEVFFQVVPDNKRIDWKHIREKHK